VLHRRWRCGGGGAAFHFWGLFADKLVLLGFACRRWFWWSRH
jgi:hypothetical protein